MAIPDYQTVMLPLLQYLSDGKEHHISEISKAMADHFELSPEERKQLISSGKGTVIRNRTGWARTYMNKAGLVEAAQRGVWRITPRGREVLAENPARIDVKFLERYPEFVEFRQFRRTDNKTGHPPENVDETPEEALESAYARLRRDLESEVLDQVRGSSPEFFERLVVELLVKMGYGGSLRDAGQAVGRSGDEGIDGIIKEDRLGLDVIYIQAKKWENRSVGRPDIQQFAGALQGQRARKGVFLTTATFSDEARKYARQIESKIVLIDGEELASLMIDHNVGVSSTGSYEIKKVDTDYFSEDEV